MEVISVVCPSRGIDGAFENYHAKFADRQLSDIRSGRQCDRPDGRFPNAYQSHRYPPAHARAALRRQCGSLAVRRRPTAGQAVFETYGGVNVEPPQDIATVPTNGRSVVECAARITLLTHNAASETRSDFAPTWSPDGQYIAFAQFDYPDSLHIWTADQHGANVRQFSAGDGFDFLPDWARLACVI